MTDDHEMDEPALPTAQAEAAATYNTVPDAIPRDAMWAAISARRAPDRAPDRAPIQATAAPVVATVVPMTVTPTTRGALTRLPRWLGAVVAVAAVIVVVAVTRETSNTPTPTAASGAATRSTTADSMASSVAWQVASAEHFGLAESMLTTLGTSTEEQGDRQLAAWSRDLLESTRLLMDSPAGRDPKRRALLQDLELVLVQLVESGPAMRTEDRSVLDEMLSRSALLLTRIRTTVPAGVPASRN